MIFGDERKEPKCHPSKMLQSGNTDLSRWVYRLLFLRLLRENILMIFLMRAYNKRTLP